jgi:hypothetical protein
MRPVYQTDVHNASSALRGLWLDKLGADLSPSIYACKTRPGVLNPIARID